MLEQQLQQYFGFTSFKNGQERVIKHLLSGQSAAAIFPTGAGKSLCYQFPALLLPNLTLVVSPLLSLMKDQIDFLKKKNIPAARLDSTLSHEEYNTIVEEARMGKLKILLISVERFRNERFRNHLKNIPLSLLVIDEAHCISEWGHNFRPEYLKLPVYRKEFSIPSVLLLTATATEKVIDDMGDKFSLPHHNVTITGFYRDNLFLAITPIQETQKQEYLLKRLQKAPTAPTIVYATLQKTAEALAEFLIAHNINASPYHAGMENENREIIQNNFMGGVIHCVVATIAFGMGIDKKDIRRVIHFDFPKSIENYSQEIGRSGRDGKLSVCEVLANKDNLNVLENFIYGDTPEKVAISTLLTAIQNNRDSVWEVKMSQLASEINMRLLPLKTLLVYLDMEGVIKPKYTYFGEYYFKYLIPQGEIEDTFKGERQNFIKAIFRHCQTKKVWTYVNITAILNAYNTERKRVVSALDYFNEKEWIELYTKSAIDVYEIIDKSFDINAISDKMYNLFKMKEDIEIERIHSMVSFFEGDVCIHKNLASYFGEHLAKNKCGHCSFCKRGRIHLERTTELPPLSTYDFTTITRDFKESIQGQYSLINCTKFLCGIHTPAFTKPKIKSLNYFGYLDKYPFNEVKNWILVS